MFKKTILRVFFCFLFLVLFDIYFKNNFPLHKSNFEENYRLPKNEEYIVLTDYIKHIKNIKFKDYKTIIVFMGSSPTYGHKIKNSINTYPYSFEKYLWKNNNNSKQIKVYNLASNGRLLSDQYYILKDLIDTADIFFIQLNYHTFNSQARTTKIFNAELPDLLGVNVDFAEAEILNRRPTPFYNLNIFLQNFLRRHWYFYANRELIAKKLFGKNPEDYFYDLYQLKRGVEIKDQNDSALDKLFTPFFELSPVKQMIIVKRYSKICKFEITKNNSEIYFLQKIIVLLKEKNKKAVFFMAPINYEAVETYELFKWSQYNENLKIINDMITKQKFLFLDLTLKHKLSGQYFFDISHTLDSGGKIVGKYLFEDSKYYLRVGEN